MKEFKTIIPLLLEFNKLLEEFILTTTYSNYELEYYYFTEDKIACQFYKPNHYEDNYFFRSFTYDEILNFYESKQK